MPLALPAPGSEAVSRGEGMPERLSEGVESQYTVPNPARSATAMATAYVTGDIVFLRFSEPFTSFSLNSSSFELS